MLWKFSEFLVILNWFERNFQFLDELKITSLKKILIFDNFLRTVPWADSFDQVRAELDMTGHQRTLINMYRNYRTLSKSNSRTYFCFRWVCFRLIFRKSLKWNSNRTFFGYISIQNFSKFKTFYKIFEFRQLWYFSCFDIRLRYCHPSRSHRFSSSR